MVFSELITNILTTRNINARQLGEAIGVTGQTISNLKAGRVLKPDAKTCEALLSYCKSYGIDTSELNWNDVIRGYFLKSKYASEYEWISDVDENANICLRHKKCRRITTVPIMSLDGVSTPCISCWVKSYLAQDAYSITLNSYKTEFPIRHNRCGHTYNVSYEQIKQKKYFCPVCYGNKLGENDETSYGTRQDYRFISDPDRITPYKRPVQPYEELVDEIEDDTPLAELSFEDFLAALDGNPRKKAEPEKAVEEDDDKPTTDALVSYVKEATYDLELYWLENDLIGCISDNFALNTYNTNPYIKTELSQKNVLSSKVYFACFDPDKCKEKVAAVCDGFTFKDDLIDKYSLLVFTTITTLDGIVHNSLSTLALVGDKEGSQQSVDGLFFYSGEGKVDPIYVAIHNGINTFNSLPDVDVRDITAVERDICEHKTTVSFFSFFKSLLLKCDDEVISELLPKVDAILNKANNFLAARELNKFAITAETLLKQVEEARLKAEEEDRRKAEEESRLAEERRKAEKARRQEEARRKAEEEARRKAEEEARRLAEERRKAEEARRQEEVRRKAEEKRRLAEERRKAEEANAVGLAKGFVVNASLEERGPVATLIVQSGTLKQDDIIVIGAVVGRVRTITDRMKGFVKVSKAPSRVKISGLSGVPNMGDTFEVVTDINTARKLSENYIKSDPTKPIDAANNKPTSEPILELDPLESAKRYIKFDEHHSYFTWLSTKISNEFLDDLITAYDRIQRFAISNNLLNKPLLDTTEITLLRRIQDTVRLRSEFNKPGTNTRYFSGLAMRHYIQYVSDLEEETRRKSEERRKAEEARRQEEARRKAEEEARRKAEEEARRKFEEEARRKAEEERYLAEERRKAEEARRQSYLLQLINIFKAFYQAKQLEETRQLNISRCQLIDVCTQIGAVKRQEEAQRQAAEERRLAEERRKAEEARRQEEARQQAEEEARRKAEEAQRKAEEEARWKAEEAQRKAEEERRLAEERRKAEEARREAEEKKRIYEEKRALYRQNNRCQHCGGEFKSFLGLFGKKCRACNRPKDY